MKKKKFKMEIKKMKNYFLSIFFFSLINLLSSEEFSPRSMAYVLQADKLAENREKALKILSDCRRDLIVIDAFYESWDYEAGRWREDELCEIRKAKNGRKLIAYLSIGEAENYRPYWNKEWDKNKDGSPDKGAPAFLEKVNPDWWGNYKVKYWRDDWQEIIIAELSKIIEQGFDGVYLDVVDAFEFFEYDPASDDWLDNRKNKETKNTYREDMIKWIQRIADYARKSKKDFIIIPQNGSQLLDSKKYMKIIDAIGVEDLFTKGDLSQNEESIGYRLSFIGKMKKVGKPVLLIEYCTQQNLKDRVLRRANKEKLILLITDRKLRALGQSFPSGISDKNEDRQKEEKDGNNGVKKRENDDEKEEEALDPFS